MKNILTSLVFLLFTISLFAQAPQGINYQAVARKTNGEPITAANVTVQFRILNGSATGTEVYRESHTAVTNAFGLFDLKIGQGIATNGTFANINWGSGTKFLEVTVQSPTGTVTNATQMMSVPYALYAAAAPGTQGPQGIPGQKGDKGDKGDTGARGLQGPSIVEQAHARQNSNVFQTGNARNAFIDLRDVVTNAPVQVVVPSDGLYLILVNVRFDQVATDDQEGRFRVLNVNDNDVELSGLVFQRSNSTLPVEIWENQGWEIRPLIKGNILKLQYEMFNPPPVVTSDFRITQGRLAILKLE